MADDSMPPVDPRILFGRLLLSRENLELTYSLTTREPRYAKATRDLSSAIESVYMALTAISEEMRHAD